MHAIIKDRQIVLGVSGGIAAYKSVELLRLLKKESARVRVMMTSHAGWFVGPGTFAALSDGPVCTGLFGAGAGADGAIRHIDWAREADAVVIAPATANVIGKLANGIADDALSTFMLAVTAPVLICPAMNVHMFESRPVQRNLDRLRQDGFHVLAPAAGDLACGTVGPGRLPEPAAILDRIRAMLAPSDFAGERVLVTAGPTHEPIDPVRFIANPSSGKMGFAIARAAEYRGAEVTLISGPSALGDPANVKVIRVQTAREMAQAVFAHMETAQVIIKAAAVADYRPETRAAHKIKKTEDALEMRLVRNQDILQELGRRKKGQILVGFAAETESLAAHATAKLAAKNLDMIVANLVGGSDSGFKADTNAVTFFFKDGQSESFPLMTKDALAHVLLDRIRTRFA